MHVVAKLVAGFELQTQKHWNVRRELQRRERERERGGWGFRSRIFSISPQNVTSGGDKILSDFRQNRVRKFRQVQ